jgi:hypothetical protein
MSRLLQKSVDKTGLLWTESPSVSILVLLRPAILMLLPRHEGNASFFAVAATDE